MEEKDEWSYEWSDTYDQWDNYYHIPSEENGPGSSHTFTGDNNIFELTKIRHNGKSKTRLVNNGLGTAADIALLDAHDSKEDTPSKKSILLLIWIKFRPVVAHCSLYTS